MLRYANLTAYSLAALLFRRLTSAETVEAEQQRQELLAPLQLLVSWLADRGAHGYGVVNIHCKFSNWVDALLSAAAELRRTTKPKGTRELDACHQFWSAAEDFIQWSRRETAQQVRAAAQQTQTALGPSVAEDLQLTGFIPLEQGHSSASSSPSPGQVVHP